MGVVTEEKPKPAGKKISSGQAARKLGVDAETVRRYGHAGLLDMWNAARPGARRQTYKFWLNQVEWLDRVRKHDSAA